MAFLLLLLVAAAALVAGLFSRTRLQNKHRRVAGRVRNGSPTVQACVPFDVDEATPTQHRPFKPIYHITMALQSASPDDLIVLDRDYRAGIATRRAVMAEHPDTVMGVLRAADGTPLPAAKAVVDELYVHLVSSYLPARYPTVFHKVAAGRDGKTAAVLHNRVTGATIPCASPTDPLEAFRLLGTTVEDDFFLLLEEPTAAADADANPRYPTTSHRLVAFLCCAPSGFDPSAKLGLLLRDIHQPVPAFDKIGPSMERVFARLAVSQSAKRLNWSVQTHTTLFAPRGNHVYAGDTVESDAAVDIAQARLRVECQTLTRLPQTRAVLFSFKTYLFPVQDIKAEGRGPDLADAIEGLRTGNAPGMWTYKGAVRWGKSVCAYLRSH